MQVESAPVIPPECNKIIERLFIFVDTKDPKLNTELQLAVNPEIIKILFKQVEHEPSAVKLYVLKQVSKIYSNNPFNSLILAKRDQQIMEFNHSILESIIQFAYTIHSNTQQVRTIVNQLPPFIHKYPINCKVIKNILSTLIKDFYEQHMSHFILKMSIGLLRVLLQHQKQEQNQPCNYFVTYGEDGGLKMMQRNVKWPFSKGFHLYIRFYIDNLTKQETNLFTLSTQNDDFIVFVSPEGDLKIKIFSYTPLVRICKIPVNKWVTLCLSYSLKSKMFKSQYDIQCTIDGSMYQKKQLPVPGVSMTDQIVEMTLGRTLYGRIHSFVLSRTQIVQGKMNMNTWSQVQSFLVINKKNIRDLFALYTPILRTTLNNKQIIYDISSQNHAQMFQNTGVHYDPFKEVDINYYGGLYTYLPLLHLLKFYTPSEYPQALTEVFELFLIFFEHHFKEVETEAINCQFMSIASQLINELNPKFMTQHTIKVIKRINNTLSNMQLRRQMILNFIFKISIRKIEEIQVINQLLTMGLAYFQDNFQWSFSIIGMDQIMHYIIDNLEEEKHENCCLHHYLHLHEKDQQVRGFSNQYLRKTTVIFRILKLIFKKIPTCHHNLSRPINKHFMQLLFRNYSACFKLMLLKTIREGVKTKSKYYEKQFDVIGFMFLYLQKIQLPEEMACVFDILMQCEQDDKENQVLRHSNIYRIADMLNRIYTKKCDQGRFRGKTIQIKPLSRFFGSPVAAKKLRKHSSMDRQDVVPSENIIRQPDHRKSEIISVKVDPIQNNKQLYLAIIRLCFEFSSKDEEWLLKDDEYCLILQPYFRICCGQHRKNIINMFRNTIVLAFHDKQIHYNVQHYNKLYKLLLTEFVLKELEPPENDQQSVPTDLGNDVIRNVYFIIDYTVINMREDWYHLYVYLLRLIGILEQAKKQILQKSNYDEEKVSLAIKMANRKLVMRVVKLSEKNVNNIANLVFLVNLTVFGNINNSSGHFSYFRSLQKYLFIGDPKMVNYQITENNKLVFLDSKLIEQTVNSFKIFDYDLVNSDKDQAVRIINAYLDTEYTHCQTQLYKNRLVYLIKAQFRDLKAQEHIFGSRYHKDKTIATGQVLGTVICLCIESALNTSNRTLFDSSIKTLLRFFLWFLLLCSRDGLKQEEHQQRNTELPLAIASNVLHFLYTMLNTKYPQEYIIEIESTLCKIFVFCGLLITCLVQKIGESENFQKALQKAVLLKNVEEYNFFTFDLFKQVLALKDLKNIPIISLEKVVNLLHHPKVSGYFRNKLTQTIDSKIQQTSKNHMKNVTDIKKNVEEHFITSKVSNISNKAFSSLINSANFQKYFIEDHLRSNNMDYRRTQRIWTKIWKRLRLYHYSWSVSMNQRQDSELPYHKNQGLRYRHKFSKFVDQNGARPVLQVEHVQPWHVKKVLMEKEFQYRNSNYLYHLHDNGQETKKKERSFLQKLMKSQLEDVFYVEWIKHNSKRKGYLSIQNQKLKFKYLSTYQKDSHLDFSSFILAEYKPVEKYWPLVEITNIIERRYLTERQCLLIEFEDGTSMIFNFPNSDKDEFVRLLESKQSKPDKQTITRLNKIAFFTKKISISTFQGLEEATYLWKNHKISNFKYLMLVNKYAGRSYLDPANYPVFPWIINNYSQNQYGYRDLSKSVGALVRYQFMQGNEQRVQFFRQKMLVSDPFEPVPPYQFGTHYSSPGVIFNFLIRLQPYTEASRTLQGGKFDLSDRLFSSINSCWKSVTSEVSDVRQLLPQFFYMPQFLLNIEQHDFGMTQQKERVHNVALPQWASSAYDFIVKHRKQLESDYVSENIGNWIDLIFGYKQRGKIAEQNLNLFFYLTYEGAIDLNDIDDEQTRKSKAAQTMHFGQTPSQLWTKPHGGRSPLKPFSFNMKKMTLVFSAEVQGLMGILDITDNNLILFHNYSILICSNQSTYKLERQVRILRNNSRENIYFLEDIQFIDRIKVFNQQKYIVVASYINGDLLVYKTADGKKVQQKKGAPKLCVHVSQKDDLMLVGNRNGLLEVYQIVYGEKDTLTLIKIASEYYMAPIHSIREGGNFFCISSGSLVTLIRASRSLNYVYDKFKMRGLKMIRALELPRKVEDCIISTDPLFCFVVSTTLEIYSYSGNGQLLATQQAEWSIMPVKWTVNFMDYLVYIENNRLKILSLPFLTLQKDIQLPNKKFLEITFFENRCFLVTNFGEIIVLSEELED